MLQSIIGNSFLTLLLLIAVAVVLLIEGLYLMWVSQNGAEARKLHRRLRALSVSRDNTQQARLLKQRTIGQVPLIERVLLGLPKARGLDRFLLQAGLDWAASKLLLSCALLGVTGWAVLTISFRQTWLVGVIASGVLAALPLLYVHRRRHRRLGRMEQQLPEALDLMTRALRSGHAFSAALKMVGEELTEPVAGEFRIVHDEVNFGVTLQQALTNLSERVPLTDLRYFVVAVLIQRESGGNLTEVLGNLSRLMRDRLKLLAKVRVLSSEGRLSAWILGVMPFALAGVMNLVNPAFMRPLWTDPIGIVMVKYTLGLMVIGLLMLRKLSRIRI
jgi:tight adherence protein B